MNKNKGAKILPNHEQLIQLCLEGQYSKVKQEWQTQSMGKIPSAKVFNYKGVCLIKRIKKTYKCLIYQCFFKKTLQRVEVRLIDMSDINLIVPKQYEQIILNENSCVNVGNHKKQQTLCFWSLLKQPGVLQRLQTTEYVRQLYDKVMQNNKIDQFEYEYNKVQLGDDIQDMMEHNYYEEHEQLEEGQYQEDQQWQINKFINNYQINFFRFLFQTALRHLQYQQPIQKQAQAQAKKQKELKQQQRYFLGFDGILYHNLIIYCRPYETLISEDTVLSLSPFQIVSIKNKLQAFHTRAISYDNLSPQSLVYVPDCQDYFRASKKKSMNYSHNEYGTNYQYGFNSQGKNQYGKLKLVLKINDNVQPMTHQEKNTGKKQQNNIKQIDQIFRDQQKALESILGDKLKYVEQQQEQDQKIEYEQRLKQEDIYSAFRRKWKEQSQNLLGNQKFLSILYKLLEVPRVYMLIQQTANYNIQKFEKQLRIVKPNIIDEQVPWFLCKYEQIITFNQQNIYSLMPTSSPLKPNNPSPKIPTVVNSISSINSPLNLIKINSSTNLASAKTTAHPNHHMPNIQIELVQSLNACSEASALLKQYRNLMEDRYCPTTDSQMSLGWGDLSVRYHYNSKNSDYQNYLLKLSRYVESLEKYLNYMKTRKIYHFYKAKLLQASNSFNQSIFNYQLCLAIIKQQQGHLGRNMIEQESENIRKVDKSNAKLLGMQYSVVCHQLGRIYAMIKQYEEALGWFNKSLSTKDIIYGRYPMQMLSTLYNAIHVIANWMENTNGAKYLQKYLSLFAQIKQNIPNEMALNRWLNTAGTKQSIVLIDKIEQQLQYLYVNPWSQIQDRLFVATNFTNLRININNVMTKRNNILGNDSTKAQNICEGAAKKNIKMTGSINSGKTNANTMSQDKISKQFQMYKESSGKYQSKSIQISHRTQNIKILNYFINECTTRTRYKQITTDCLQKGYGQISKQEQLDKIHASRKKLQAQIRYILESHQHCRTEIKEQQGQVTYRQSSSKLNMQHANLIRLRVLDIYMTQTAAQLDHGGSTSSKSGYVKALVASIQNLKQIIEQLNKHSTKLESKGTSSGRQSMYAQLSMDIRQLVYSWYRILNKYIFNEECDQSNTIGSPVDWQWILKQYYQHKYHLDSQAQTHTNDFASSRPKQQSETEPTSSYEGNRTATNASHYVMYKSGIFNLMKQECIYNNIQYLLLVYKYYADYGHIYNVICAITNSTGIVTDTFKELNIGSYQLSEKIILLYMLCLSLLHMHKYKQAIFILRHQITLYSSNLSSDNNSSSSNRSIEQAQALLPKGNIYQEQFHHMLLFCYYKSNRFNQFIQFFESTHLSHSQGCMNEGQPVGSLEGHILAKQQATINKIAVLVYYKLLSHSPVDSPRLQSLKASIIRFKGVLELRQKQANIIFLRVLARTWQHSQSNNCKSGLLDSSQQLLSYIKAILFKDDERGMGEIRDDDLGDDRNGSYRLFHMLQQCPQYHEYCNIKQFYCQTVCILVRTLSSYNNMQNTEDLYRHTYRTINSLVYQLLAPLLHYEAKSKYSTFSLSKLIALSSPGKEQAQAALSNLRKQLISRLSNQIISYITINVQESCLCPNQHQHRENLLNTQPLSYDRMTNDMVNLWVPGLVVQIVDSQEKSVGQSDIRERNHLHRTQIKDIMQMLIKWLRYNHMYRQSVLCCIWINNYHNDSAYSSTTKLKQSQVFNKQYETLVNDILCIGSSSQGQLIKMPQFFTALELDTYMQQMINKLNNAKKQCMDFIMSFNKLKQQADSGYDHYQDVDDYINAIQLNLHRLQIIRFNMLVFLPKQFMHQLNLQFFDVVKQKVEEL